MGLPGETRERQAHVDEVDHASRSEDNISKESPLAASETLSESSQDEEEKDSENRSPQQGSTRKSRRKTPQGKEAGQSKRVRTLLTLEQSRVLHELLQQTCFPSTKVREDVAAQLGLSPRKVQVFFQNKRQKQRKKSNLSASSAQLQKIAPKPDSPPSTVPEHGASDGHIPSKQPDQLSPPYNSQKSSPPSLSEQSRMDSFYSQRPHDHYGYETGWSPRLMDQRRPRYTYHPYSAYYWHRPSALHRTVYSNAAPRMTQRFDYQRECIDPSKGLLPPIMSEVRTNAPRLPSINEMISRAHA